MSESIAPRITVVTLGVSNLVRSVAFYRDGLGWASEGIIGTEFPDGAVAFFTLAGGLRLALWPRKSLARDAGVAQGAPSQTELSLGYNVTAIGEVDRVFALAVAAGAIAIKEPTPTFWGGYAGYFADPDGHLWEVVYNPDLLPE